jgi:hypothetical protein
VEPVSCSGFADAVISHFETRGWQDNDEAIDL